MIPLGILAATHNSSNSGDPYWSSVVSLLNFQGADGSTTFTDETGKTWSRTGTPHIEVSGAESYGVFAGGSDGIYTADSADFDFGGDDFCIEAIVTPTSLPAAVQHIAGQFGSAPGMSCQLYLWSNQAGMAVATASTGAYDSSFDLEGGTLSAGARAHVALVRSGDLFSVYVGGASVRTKTDSRTLFNSSKNFMVSRNDYPSTGQAFAGKIHALRVTKGVPRYTAAFTPPTAPFPNS